MVRKFDFEVEAIDIVAVDIADKTTMRPADVKQIYTSQRTQDVPVDHTVVLTAQIIAKRTHLSVDDVIRSFEIGDRDRRGKKPVKPAKPAEDSELGDS